MEWLLDICLKNNLMPKKYKTVIYDADDLNASYIAKSMNKMTSTGWVINMMQDITRCTSSGGTREGMLVVVYEKDIPEIKL